MRVQLVFVETKALQLLNVTSLDGYVHIQHCSIMATMGSHNEHAAFYVLHNTSKITVCINSTCINSTCINSS